MKIYSYLKYVDYPKVNERIDRITCPYLRYKHPRMARPYKVPFGNCFMWIICIFGIIASLLTILIGYFPPAQLKVGNIFFYESFLILGFGLFYAIPLLLYAFRRRSWRLDKASGDKILAASDG